MAICLRKIVLRLLSLIPGTPSISQLSTSHEKNGYWGAEGGFFLKTYGGGGKLSQIFVSRKGGSAVLPDTPLQHGKAVLTLLILHPRDNTETEGIRNILEEHEILLATVSNDSIDSYVNDPENHQSRICFQFTILIPSQGPRIWEELLHRVWRRNLGSFVLNAKYVILRLDLINISVARTFSELRIC
jgi:hypothetical protein